MAKEFAARVSKKERNYSDVKLDPSRFIASDNKLLRGAMLEKVQLKSIEVRTQVRTKFNDDSLRELGENIQANGLIQPLVVHREGEKFVLICGERRYRAMTLIEMKEAPCFVLENKTNEELMAIQFSENSSRENLHYIDQAQSIYDYKKMTGASERKIVSALSVSKSEVHRCLLIGQLPAELKEAAKMYNIEKYVLLEWGALEDKTLKNNLLKMITEGKIVKRSQLTKITKEFAPTITKKEKAESKKTRVSASLLVQALKLKGKELDPEMRAALEKLVIDTKSMIEQG